MALLGGDKNSPKTTSQSASSTKNTQISPTVTAGANSNIGGPVTLSDLSGVTAPITISTTDQGAVNAGLQTALAALDSNNSTVQSALSQVGGTAQEAITSASNVNSDLASLSGQAIAGQQNTSLKYLIWGVAVLVAGAVAYAYFSKSK
jgi:hypothetical protein